MSSYKIKNGVQLPEKWKIMVNEVQSIIVQKFAFSLGLRWASGDTNIINNIQYIFCNGYYLSCANVTWTFINNPWQRIIFSDTFEEENNLLHHHEAIKLIAWMYDHVMQIEDHQWISYTGAHLTHEQVLFQYQEYTKSIKNECSTSNHSNPTTGSSIGDISQHKRDI